MYNIGIISKYTGEIKKVGFETWVNLLLLTDEPYKKKWEDLPMFLLKYD